MTTNDYLMRELEIASKVRQDTETSYSCDSVKEALAWLRVGPFSGVVSIQNTFGYYNKKNFIYRGHRDSSWSISPTIDRCNDKEKELIVTKSFSDLSSFYINTVLSSDIINLSPTFEKQFGECAAQHYGLYTNLVDWTTQPEVAASFAYDKSKRTKKGKIFMLETSKCVELGLSVIIPPPIVKRLYLQRGLFIEFDKEVQEELNKSIISIEFTHQDFEQISIFDNLAEPDALLPDDDWFTALQAHCKKRVFSEDFNPNYEIVKESFRLKKGFEHPYLQTIINTFINFIDEEEFDIIKKMLQSLVIEYTNGKKIINQAILNAIKNKNHALVETIGDFSK